MRDAIFDPGGNASRRFAEDSHHLAACSSTIEHDAVFEECAGWCSASEKESHCPWCKCRSCEFCGGGSDPAPYAVQAPAAQHPARGCPVEPSHGPLRLGACGAELIPSGGRLPNGGPGKPVVLSGVNMFLQYYMELPSARNDIRWLREAVPNANV